ncbi:MAG: MBL fold metallo-hydrolase [Gemmatimonadales bacterium]
MPQFICVTCGTQFPDTDTSPPGCPICQDARQYVGWDGQRWTTIDDLRRRHQNALRRKEPGLVGIGMTPAFAIGQRALLVRGGYPLLWDCVSLIDDTTVDIITGLGGLSAIAISHPHYYTSMIAWSHAFGGIPVYLHQADREWVVRPDPVVHWWEGETLALADDLTLIRLGGHFAGGTVLHWAGGADGRGALLTGDIIQVVQDRRYVSFMYSYPNLIPLPAATVQGMVDRLAPFDYDRIYGAWWDRNIMTGAADAVRRSADRYVRALSDPRP